MALHARRMHIEGRCDKCGETVVLSTGEELEHFADANGNECGGTVTLQGEWF